jgi:acyl-CoA synthetase (AMP-forming)/AMP-acid ligase II
MLSAQALAPVARDPSDLAWLFYTSGTTGRPKGAMLSHRNLLFMSHAYHADIDMLGPLDTKLHAGPMSHASGLYALPHLLRGGHQVVFAGFDIAQIEDALARYDRITMFAVPTTLTRLVAAWQGRDLPLQHLKTIYYGGAPMYVADLKRAIDLFGPRLFQLFGQGESPMTITGLEQRLHRNDGSAETARLLASCGYARTGVGVAIVGADGKPLPAGEVGEVITRSDCVMKGYWNNAKANADALRDGWLHTGDLGSMAEDGLLTLTDRSKDLIISGGTNIYPREIEEVLLTHDDIVEAAVIGAPDREWGEHVVAFVVMRPGTTVTLAELDRLCLDQLARFKRPKHYRFVDALPKSGYGKILKTELRKLLPVETLSP